MVTVVLAAGDPTATASVTPVSAVLASTGSDAAPLGSAAAAALALGAGALVLSLHHRRHFARETGGR